MVKPFLATNQKLAAIISLNDATYIAIAISQIGHALLSVPVIWLIWGPIEPIHGLVQMLPNPFSGHMLIMLSLFILKI